MANFSAAFGYDFYIVPVQNALVTDFESALNIDTSSPASDATVSYTAGVFTIAGTEYAMDGTDAPIRLAALTNAALETDTGSEDIYTYDDETSGFNQSVATTKSFSISLSGIADFNDSGYKVLRLTGPEHRGRRPACCLPSCWSYWHHRGNRGLRHPDWLH